MDWSRVARLLNVPLEKLAQLRVRSADRRRVDAWEARMKTQSDELEALTVRLREATARRASALEAVASADKSAEDALRAGDEDRARAVLLRKREHVERLESATKESEVLRDAIDRGKERLLKTRGEANELLAAAGLPPLEPPPPPEDAPPTRVRVKV